MSDRGIRLWDNISHDSHDVWRIFKGARDRRLIHDVVEEFDPSRKMSRKC